MSASNVGRYSTHSGHLGYLTLGRRLHNNWHFNIYEEKVGNPGYADVKS
jgi:hypothetical protein